MSVKVFQVDQSPRLMPYAYEREAIGAAGGEFVVESCTSEAEIVEQAVTSKLFVSVRMSPDGELEPVPRAGHAKAGMTRQHAADQRIARELPGHHDRIGAEVEQPPHALDDGE